MSLELPEAEGADRSRGELEAQVRESPQEITRVMGIGMKS